MYLPVTVQAVLAHDETLASTREIIQAPYMPAAISPATAVAGATTATITRTATTAVAWTAASSGTAAHTAISQAGDSPMAASAEAADPTMTLLAQLRSLAVEQRGMIRTMHPVTQGAILGNREVFPQKRPALLCMAGVTVLVLCKLLQGRGAGTAVRVVAVAADYLGFPDGVPGGPESLGTDILVTAETDLGLGCALAHLVRLVDGMATDTGQVLAFVDTGWPVLKHATLVAPPTHAVLLVGWRRRVSRIGDQPALVSTFIKHIDDVGFTRAVAGLATLSCKGGTQVHFLAVLVVVDLHDVCGMALATGLAVEITRTTVGRRLRLFLGDRFRMQTAGAQAHGQKYQGSDEGMHIAAIFLGCAAPRYWSLILSNRMCDGAFSRRILQFSLTWIKTFAGNPETVHILPDRSGPRNQLQASSARFEYPSQALREIAGKSQRPD